MSTHNVVVKVKRRGKNQLILQSVRSACADVAVSLGGGGGRKSERGERVRHKQATQGEGLGSQSAAPLAVMTQRRGGRRLFFN